MTGTDRLRSIAGAWDEWGLGGTLAEIADEIERDFADARMGHVSLMRILEVASDMERHVLGHEGMEDSPVARWARELREALGGAVTDEDREAAAWVREHGGLDYVKGEWRSRVPYDRYARKRQRLIHHIAECETALGRRREIISRLGHRVSDLTTENAEMRRRAMPDGMEWLIEAWPKFEDDAPLKLGDMALIDGDVDMVEAVKIWIHGKPVICGDNGSQQLEKGERVRRPAPSVPAGDGEPLEVGQTVWDTDDETDTPLTVVEVSSDLVRCEYTWKDGKTYRPCYPPDQLTHTKPEPPDSWERIEEDARLKPFGYVDRVLGWDMSKSHSQNQARSAMTHDLVRRCRALAERERGD